MDYRLVEAIKCYLKGEQFNTIVDQELIDLSLEQGLTALLYTVTKDKSLKKYYINQVMIQEKFIKLQDELTDLFNKNGIKHLYFKGAVLYKLYPDSAIRSRGDIDLLVEKKDMEKALKLMKEIGYTDDPSGEACQHHVGMYKNNLEVEVHFLLFDPDVTYNIDIFNNPFKYAIVENEYLYKMTDTNHFFFWLCHFQNHLIYGAGLRYMLDFYFIIINTNIDFDLLHEYIDEFGLTTLFNNLLNSVYYLTNKKYDNVEIIDVDFFVEYLTKSGIHGFGKEGHHEPYYQGKHKIRYILRTAFMIDREYRVSIYPKAGKHWYCYPFILVHRIVKLVFTKTHKLLKVLFKRKNKEEKELMKKLGV